MWTSAPSTIEMLETLPSEANTLEILRSEQCGGRWDYDDQKIIWELDNGITGVLYRTPKDGVGASFGSKDASLINREVIDRMRFHFKLTSMDHTISFVFRW